MTDAATESFEAALRFSMCNEVLGRASTLEEKAHIEKSHANKSLV